MQYIEGSLTKELPLVRLDATMRLARHGMRYVDFRAAAETHTHVEAAALVRNRFLIIEEERIVRDHFLSLVESEDITTRRMRKIMYGVWVMRDRRFKAFILEIIADANGKWQPAELINKSHHEFLGSAKTRSNFERFFVETGIYDPNAQSVNLEIDDMWIEDSIRAASRLEEDPGIRHEMQNDPLNYVVRNNLNGLFNSTVGELRTRPTFAALPAEPITDNELADVGLIPVDGQPWQRPEPVFNANVDQTFTANAVLRERANAAHYRLERLLSDKIRESGFEPLFNANIDIYFENDSGTFLFEVKSCHVDNFHVQVRRGVAQLLEYNFRYRTSLTNPVNLYLVVETEPPTNEIWIKEFLRHIGITLVWHSSEGNEFFSTLEGDSPLPRIINRK